MSDPNAPLFPDPDSGQGREPSYRPASATPLTAAEDQQWASFAHLGGIVWFLPSLIIWLVFRDRGQRTAVEAKEALNFQITFLIVYFGLVFLSAFLPALALLLFPLWVVNVVFSVLGFLAVKAGRSYRYPVTLRLLT